jgi:YVTN family beta-propeller protein
VRDGEFALLVVMPKFLVFLIGALTAMQWSAAAADYKPLTEIPIGGEGGWDILTVDDAMRRLYLSHATKVVVVDIDAGKVAGEIADTPGVHAFVAVPELQRGFSSNGKENKSSVVDLKTLRTIKKIEVGDNPDAVAYDAKRGELYVFNHSGNSVTVIDARKQDVVTTIPLGGSPEFPAVDSVASRIYVNLEDKSEVAVIDLVKHEVVARWPLSPGEEPTGIALDKAHHRLFSACHNKLMTMLDSESGKIVGTVPIGAGVDGCVFDDATQLVFASCGEGVTTIAKEETSEKLTVIQTLSTKRGARTIALDAKTHRIYLPTAEFESTPTPSPGATPGRPAIVPKTMKLLVYGRAGP